MAFFYVKVGGSATGDTGRYATKQTGAFSGLTAYYATVGAAMLATTPPASGDFILVSDSHNEAITSDVQVGLNAVGHIYMVSVDDLNCDLYKKSTTSQFDMTSVGTLAHLNLHSRGIYFDCATSFAIAIANRSNQYSSIKDSTLFVSSGSSDSIIQLNATNSVLTLDDIDIILASGVTSSYIFSVTGQATVKANNIRTTTQGGTFGGLVLSGTASLTTYITNSDLSLLPSLVTNIGGVIGDDLQIHNLDNCQVANLVNWINETAAYEGFEANFSNCTDSVDNHANQFHSEQYAGSVDGIVEDGTALVVRTNSTELSMEDAGTYLALQVVTNASCGNQSPVNLSLGTTLASLATANGIRMYFAGPAGLLTTDIHMSMSARDTTNNGQVITQTIGSHDPLTDGAALDADVQSNWTNAGALSKYYVDFTFSSGTYSDGLPNIKVSVTKPSVTIYFDPEYELI